MGNHVRLVVAAWALIFGVLLLSAYFLRLDTGSAAFFPDTPADVGRMAADMDMAPFSRLLFVDLSVPAEAGAQQRESDTRERLAAAADALLAAIPPELASRAGSGELPRPSGLLALLPSVLEDPAPLVALHDPVVVQNALRDTRAALNSFMGGMGGWIQADPFNLRRWLWPALPLRAALPMPDPVLGYAFSPDGRHLLLALRPVQALHDVDAALELMRTLDTALEALPQGIRATVVGGHRHTAVNSATIMTDIETIVLWSLVGFALVYLVLVCSVGALWLVLTPCLAAACAMGSMAFAWPVISGLALGFGASVLGLAEDYAVHVHFALRQRAGEPAPATAVSLARLTPPLVQALLMNCAGFAVLLFSGIPAVRQLAFFAMMTLVLGLALALTLLPLCPWQQALFSRPSAPDAGTPHEPRLSRTLPITALLLGALLLLYPHLRVDVSPRTLGAGMAQLEADAARLQSVWGEALRSTAFVVHAPDEAAALERTQRLTRFLRASGTADVLSLTDLLPPPAQAQERLARWQTTVDALRPALWSRLDDAARAQRFTPTAFAPFRAWFEAPAQINTPDRLREAGLGEMVDMFLRSGPQETRMLVVASGETPPLPPDMRDTVVQLSPHELEASLLEAMRQESRLLPVVFALVLVMLVLCLRRPGHMLLAALPPLTALVGVLAWMVATGTPLTLASITALPLMLSLAIDHGLVVTYDLGRGASAHVERSMLVSSLTSVLGMGLLALAEHPALRSMGQVIVIGLTLEFVTARWLLPRLCEPSTQGTS